MKYFIDLLCKWEGTFEESRFWWGVMHSTCSCAVCLKDIAFRITDVFKFQKFVLTFRPGIVQYLLLVILKTFLVDNITKPFWFFSKLFLTLWKNVHSYFVTFTFHLISSHHHFCNLFDKLNLSLKILQPIYDFESVLFPTPSSNL